VWATRQGCETPARTTAWLVLGALAAALGAGCSEEPREDPARSPARSAESIGGVATSEAGRYRVALEPADPPVRIGALHDWVLRLERTDGAAAEPTSLQFTGGMPAHGHGFVTAPRVTRRLDDGGFLVEGVKFHMGGAWELRVTLSDPLGRDRAILPIDVDP